MATLASQTVEFEVRGNLCGRQALAMASMLPVTELMTARRVVLSLRGVESADAAGLAVLVRLHSHLRVRGAVLSIVGATRGVSDLLSRVGFADLLDTPSTSARRTEARVLAPVAVGS